MWGIRSLRSLLTIPYHTTPHHTQSLIQRITHLLSHVPELNGILQWSLVSLAKRPLIVIKRLVLAQMEIITIFTTATAMCRFHRLRQTAMTGIF